MQKEISSIPEKYKNKWLLEFSKKIGLKKIYPENEVLINRFLEILESENLDFTNSFYSLSFLIEKDQIEKEGPPKSHRIYSKIKSSDWYSKWKKRLNVNKKNLKKILKTLLINNPSIIPRNHIVEKVINDAINKNKKDSLNDFLFALNTPYKIRTFDNPYTKTPLPNEEVTQTFCGT